MESLYTKYRPQTFDEVVGQTHVVETLKRAVLEGRTSHAYLFCGPRGTGKTTMARILAKALLCDAGPGVLPDGTCEQCQLIAAGNHPDVVELDAASRTGVDNVREEIINRVNYAPTMGRAKIYIIDEVHMLTTAAFNALLKTLEEPPEHVVFVMCTTDPQKVPATIQSRVQRFDFRSIGNEEMRDHLVYVCNQEGFVYEDEALDLVVRHARGGMRDALTTLEQLSVFGNGSVTLAAARDLLGETSASTLSALSLAIAQRDVPSLFAQVDTLVNSGQDLLQLTRELAAHLRDVYVVSLAPRSDAAVAAKAAELDALRDEAAAFGSSDRIARALSVLSDAASEMRTAPNQQLVLEVALTKLARPESDLTLESLAERVAELEQRVAELEKEVATATVESQPTAASVVLQPVSSASMTTPSSQQAGVPQAPAQRQASSQVASAQRPVVTPAASTQRPANKPQASTQQSASALQASTPATPAQHPASSSQTSSPATSPQHLTSVSNGADAAQLQRMWNGVVNQLTKQDPSKGHILDGSRAVSDDGEVLVVEFEKASRFITGIVSRGDFQELVGSIVEQSLGPRRIQFEFAGSKASTKKGAAQTSSRTSSTSRVSVSRRSTASPQPATAQPAPAPKSVSPAPVTPAPSEPEPAPQPYPSYSVEYDQVPYEDYDVPVYEEDYEPVPASAPASVPKPAPEPTPAPESASTPTSTPEPVSEPSSNSPDEIDPLNGEFSFDQVRALLAESFGELENVRTVPSSREGISHIDDDAVTDDTVVDDLAYDVEAFDENGFTAEPYEDDY